MPLELRETLDALKPHPCLGMQREPRRKTALRAGDSLQRPSQMPARQEAATSCARGWQGVRWVRGGAGGQELSARAEATHPVPVRSPRCLRQQGVVHSKALAAAPRAPTTASAPFLGMVKADPLPRSAQYPPGKGWGRAVRKARNRVLPRHVTHRTGTPSHRHSPWAVSQGVLGDRPRPNSARQLAQTGGEAPTRCGRWGANSKVRLARAAGAPRARAFGVAAHLVGFLGGTCEAEWSERPSPWTLAPAFGRDKAHFARIFLNSFRPSIFPGNPESIFPGNPEIDSTPNLLVVTAVLFCFETFHFRYPLSGETLQPFARFDRKRPKDSNLAEDGFPGLTNQEFLGSFSTNYSICSA